MADTLLSPLGATIVVLAFWWLILALRRIRFDRPGHAPGVVEVDEGQVGYLGPTFGGYVSLRELTEVQLMTLRGERHWRLKQADGQALLIPHGAAGAEALFDAFATLPGADMAVFTAALDRTEDMRWSGGGRRRSPLT